MFYPIFMPTVGGGPSSGKDAAFVLAVYVGALYVAGVWIHKPSYEMKVTQYGQINSRRLRGPAIKQDYTHVNIDCLQKKGYTIYRDKEYITSYWETMLNVTKQDKVMRQFLADCKECNVYTEVRYAWEDVLSNEYEGRKKLYWHKNYKPLME